MPLTRSRRAGGLAAALLLSVVLVAGCTGSSGSPAAAPTRAAATPASRAVSGCLPQASCYAPYLFRVAYGIQPLLEKGTDGRGQTVTVLSPAPSPSAPAGPSRGSNQLPAATDIRQHLKAFDSKFGLPAARIQVVTSLAGAASPWQASGEEVEDFEIVQRSPPPPPSGWSCSLPTSWTAPRTRPRTCSPRCGAPSPAPTWPRLAGAWGSTTSRRPRWPRCTPSCWGRPLATSRWTPAPATAARPATLGGACPSRRSAFRPPTRSCWALAAPRSPQTARPAPTSARPPGRARPAEDRGAASATGTPLPPIRMAFPGSQR